MVRLESSKIVGSSPDRVKPNIGNCSLSGKHAALMSKSKDLLAWNQDDVCKWSDMSTSELLFQ